MATLNYNSSAFTGASPTVWRLQAIEDRDESTVMEWLKDYTNSIIRDDDKEPMFYPKPNEGYTRSYQVKRRLLGAGVSGSTAQAGSEEKFRGNTFTFSNTFRRHAVAHEETIPATDILAADYMRNERLELSKWSGYKKQNADIGRIITGATIKLYGNNDQTAFANLTTSDGLKKKSFAVVSNALKRYNAKEIEMMPDVDNAMSYRFFVVMIDELVLDSLQLDDSWLATIEPFFQNSKFNSPINRVSYGKQHNLMIIPVESVAGFGSPLRPELIIAADGDSISNAANDDEGVGIPNWDGTSAYDDYTPDGKIAFTEYLSNYNTALYGDGTTTGCLATIYAYDNSATYEDMTIKIGSTNTNYTVYISNGSGGAYVPSAGDRIILDSSVMVGLGASAYISSYPSAMWFTKQTEDYEFEQGIAVNFWEGGAVVQNVRSIVNNIVLNFIHADILAT